MFRYRSLIILPFSILPATCLASGHLAPDVDGLLAVYIAIIVSVLINILSFIAPWRMPSRSKLLIFLAMIVDIVWIFLCIHWYRADIPVYEDFSHWHLDAVNSNTASEILNEHNRTVDDMNTAMKFVFLASACFLMNALLLFRVWYRSKSDF
jgi:hypothetical protein